MTLIENLNRARELAGMKPLSEAQKQALTASVSDVVKKVWPLVKAWEQSHDTTHEEPPTEEDVEVWAKEFLKNNPSLGLAEIDETDFYESFDN